MRFNVKIENEVMGENHPDQRFSDAVLSAINGMAAGCDVEITRVVETVSHNTQSSRPGPRGCDV